MGCDEANAEVVVVVVVMWWVDVHAALAVTSQSSCTAQHSTAYHSTAQQHCMVTNGHTVSDNVEKAHVTAGSMQRTCHTIQGTSLQHHVEAAVERRQL